MGKYSQKINNNEDELSAIKDKFTSQPDYEELENLMNSAYDFDFDDENQVKHFSALDSQYTK